MKKETYTVTLTRLEMFDIRIALLSAGIRANDGGAKFMAIRDKLVTLMAQQDRED